MTARRWTQLMRQIVHTLIWHGPRDRPTPHVWHWLHRDPVVRWAAVPILAIVWAALAYLYIPIWVRRAELAHPFDTRTPAAQGSAPRAGLAPRHRRHTVRGAPISGRARSLPLAYAPGRALVPAAATVPPQVPAAAGAQPRPQPQMDGQSSLLDHLTPAVHTGGTP